MPANSRWDLIRRLRVNTQTRSKIQRKGMRVAIQKEIKQTTLITPAKVSKNRNDKVKLHASFI